VIRQTHPALTFVSAVTSTTELVLQRKLAP
jgi:hypothetical protein